MSQDLDVNTIKHLVSERSKLYTEAFLMFALLVMTIAVVSMLINSDNHVITKFIFDSADTQ